MKKVTVYNQPGNGGLSAPRIGTLAPGACIDAELPEEMVASFETKSPLQVAEQGSPQAADFHKAAKAYADRNKPPAAKPRAAAKPKE